MGGWSWHIGTYHWVSGFRKHFFIRSGKICLILVVFLSNVMHGSIFDTNYTAMQSDLNKLQQEEKEALFTEGQELPSPRKPLEPART